MAEVMAPSDTLGERLRVALQEGLAKRGVTAEVETEPVPTTLMHRAFVTSPQFEEMGPSERQEVIWAIVRHALPPDEQILVSIIYAFTPDEIEGKA